MNNNLLQKVGNESHRSSSGNGLKLMIYAVSLVVAFIAGARYEHAKAPAAPDMESKVTQSMAEPTPAPIAAATPSATPAAVVKAATPALITYTGDSPKPAATPVRVEKAIAIATPSATTTMPAAPVAPVAVPIPVAKPANAVTVTEAVEIPVKQGAKVVGYINLKPGQYIVPVSVDNGQIKVKTGENFVYVPVKSTDMPQH
jgi:hypothetical protein